MQVPKRKPGKYSDQQTDYRVTREKYNSFCKELKRLESKHRDLVAEVQRLAEMGDFSENAAYQMAKGKLRGLNNRISELEDVIKKADIIETPAKGMVGLGSKVTIDLDGKQQTYTILGSAEADPLRGIISSNSPIGSALMGHRVGEMAMINIGSRETKCTIVAIH